MKKYSFLLVVTVAGFYPPVFAEKCKSAFNGNYTSPEVIQILKKAGDKYHEISFATTKQYRTQEGKDLALNEIIEILKPALTAKNTKSALLAHKIYQDLGKNEEARHVINQALGFLNQNHVGTARNKDVSDLYMRRAEMDIKKAETTGKYLSLVENLEIAGELGNPIAYKTIANWYLEGKGDIPKNLIKSHVYSQKSYYYELYNNRSYKVTINSGSAKAYLYDYYKKQKSNEHEQHLLFKEIESLSKDLEVKKALAKKFKNTQADEKKTIYALEKVALAQMVFIAAHDTIISLDKNRLSEIDRIENDFFNLVHDKSKGKSISSSENIVKSLDPIISHLKEKMKNKDIDALVKNMKEVKINAQVVLITPEIKKLITEHSKYEQKINKKTLDEIAEELGMTSSKLDNIRLRGSSRDITFNKNQLERVAQVIPALDKSIERLFTE